MPDYEPVSYGSLKDLKHGKGHAAPAPGASGSGSKKGLFSFGRKPSADVPPPPHHAAQPPVPQAPPAGQYGHTPYASSQGAEERFRSATRTYTPPSERQAGQEFTGRPMKNQSTKPYKGDGEEERRKEMGWGEWASSGVNSAYKSASGSVASGWDSVNSVQKRDQVVGGIGKGAATVVGGAIKYTAKGVWAVGKAATK